MSRMEECVRSILRKSISSDYSDMILDTVICGDTVINRIISNIKETSEYEETGCWGVDDVRLAIGRVVLETLEQTGGA